MNKLNKIKGPRILLYIIILGFILYQILFTNFFSNYSIIQITLTLIVALACLFIITDFIKNTLNS